MESNALLVLGKVTFKSNDYNIALLPKKLLIKLLSYFLWKVMCYQWLGKVTFKISITLCYYSYNPKKSN